MTGFSTGDKKKYNTIGNRIISLDVPRIMDYDTSRWMFPTIPYSNDNNIFRFHQF